MKTDMEIDDIKIRELIKTIAKTNKLVNMFSDIKVVYQKNIPASYVNIKTKEMYINLASTIFTKRIVPIWSFVFGLEAHESGHIDHRFFAPQTAEIFEKERKELIEKAEDLNINLIAPANVILNILYDFEIHKNYLDKKMIDYKYQKNLNRLLINTWNYEIELFEKKRKESKLTGLDLIALARIPYYCAKTKEEKEIIEKIRKILHSNLSFVDKGIELSKLFKNDGGGGGGCILLIEMIGDENINEDNNKKRKKKKNKTAISIIEDIKQEKKQQEEINRKIEQLKKTPFGKYLSTEKLKKLLSRVDGKNTELTKIENLEKIYKKITKIIDKVTSKKKTIETKNGIMRGWRKHKTVEEIVGSSDISDLLLAKKFGTWNNIRVEKRLKQKENSIIAILRDTSGSTVDRGAIEKFCRDVTILLISISATKRLKVGVMDFHSQPEPILQNGKFWGYEYGLLMLDSYDFKEGFSTNLDIALLELIKFKEKEGIKEEIQVYVITDTEIYSCEKIYDKLKKAGIKVSGIYPSKYENDKAEKVFIELVKETGGKLFECKINDSGLYSLIEKTITSVG